MDHSAYLASMPPGFPAAGDYRDVITFSWRQMFRRQTRTLYLFGYYSPRDRAYYFLPSITHKLSDDLAITLGADIFGGADSNTFFGQFDENDNLYASLRLDF